MSLVSPEQVMSDGERGVRGLGRGFASLRHVTPVVADLLLALGVAAVSLGVLVGSPERPQVPISRLAVMLVLLQTLPLAARQRGSAAARQRGSAAARQRSGAGPWLCLWWSKWLQ